ncbi:MAG: phosphonate C-P lyase system protein PhnG, partial [Acetobacteraceae bacterium]|nr:phosphonate C-P lyase system protein PhnG [Acetobacteraceae bacterium]
MGVLARATAAEIADRLRDAPPLPPHTRLRGPQTGLVMVRGRQGGDGAAFNLGEMTVTRCVVGIHGGLVGHA